MVDFEELTKPLKRLKIKSHQLKGAAHEIRKEFFSVAGLYHSDLVFEFIDCVVSSMRREFISSFSGDKESKNSVDEIKQAISTEYRETLEKIKTLLNQMNHNQVMSSNPFDIALLGEEDMSSIGVAPNLLNKENFVFDLGQIFSRIESLVEEKFEFGLLEREILFGLNLEGAIQFPYDENHFLKPKALPFLKAVFSILLSKNQVNCSYEEFEKLFSESEDLITPIFFKQPVVLRGIIKEFKKHDFFTVDTAEAIRNMKGRIIFDHCDQDESNKKIDGIASNWTKVTDNPIVVSIGTLLKKHF